MILVTGATGFIGTRVVHELRARDRQVRALVHSPARAGSLANWDVELATGDVTDPASLRAAADGCDEIVHLVSILTGSKADFERVMEQGTRNLVEAAAPKRLVLMSAIGADNPATAGIPYFESKREMERAVRESGFEFVILRPSFVFGDGGALATFLRLARRAPVTPIIGDGTSRIQPVWVDDVARAVAESLERPEAAGKTLELGGPEIVTWNDFWARLKKAAGLRRPSVHVPFSVMRVQAALLEKLPSPPLTRDQLRMLQAGDNVVTGEDAAGVLGLELVPLDEQLRRVA
ncbi:MAG: complex I NDUFA9 subunit family protein [Gaiellaceae bacterium]